jgi:DNA mismatch endonuclease (patch repair protein)
MQRPASPLPPGWTREAVRTNPSRPVPGNPVADTFTPEQRSALMRSIRGTDTVPERVVRALLHASGYRFRLHRRDLPGRPDIVLTRFKTIVLVHGCFWHAHPGCKANRIPATNSQWWETKLRRNAERDRAVVNALEALGWHVEIVWECETKPTKRPALRERLVEVLESRRPIRPANRPDSPGSTRQAPAVDGSPER